MPSRRYWDWQEKGSHFLSSTNLKIRAILSPEGAGGERPIGGAYPITGEVIAGRTIAPDGVLRDAVETVSRSFSGGRSCGPIGPRRAADMGSTDRPLFALARVVEAERQGLAFAGRIGRTDAALRFEVLLPFVFYLWEHRERVPAHEPRMLRSWPSRQGRSEVRERRAPETCVQSSSGPGAYEVQRG